VYFIYELKYILLRRGQQGSLEPQKGPWHKKVQNPRISPFALHSSISPSSAKHTDNSFQN